MTSDIGTYAQEDITFLLSPLSELELQRLYKTAADKEALIQQGHAHYSEMLSREQKPDERYLSIFNDAVARFGQRMGRDIAQLAVDLDSRIPGPVTLLSLVRAGVPVGILLHRALKALGKTSAHYGISIIRDKGLDRNAMKYILERHSAQSMVFVDGWTGKGAITDELHRSLRADSHTHVEPRLVTLADPAGRAWLSASTEDWLIPSGILGSTVSGLISRSVLRQGYEQSDEFHATALLHELQESDLSRQFVDTIYPHVLEALPDTVERVVDDASRTRAAAQASQVIEHLATEFSIDNLNRIKPGIAEATRAVLRRLPDTVIVSKKDDDDLTALVHLASVAGVPLEERGAAISPYRAVTIISDRGDKRSA